MRPRRRCARSPLITAWTTSRETDRLDACDRSHARWRLVMLHLIAAALALWQPNLFSSVPSRGALLAITASELKVTTYAPLASAAAMTLEERLG